MVYEGIGANVKLLKDLPERGFLQVGEKVKVSSYQDYTNRQYLGFDPDG